MLFRKNLHQLKFPLYGIYLEMSHLFRQNYPQVNSPIVFSSILNLCARNPTPIGTMMVPAGVGAPPDNTSLWLITYKVWFHETCLTLSCGLAGD